MLFTVRRFDLCPTTGKTGTLTKQAVSGRTGPIVDEAYHPTLVVVFEVDPDRANAV